jgi:hypothetical protein
LWKAGDAMGAGLVDPEGSRMLKGLIMPESLPLGVLLRLSPPSRSSCFLM